ncbi:hypothetical protein IQ07DRAFT_585886 [Pyrenochaeta sp. DS3sAY3a]|nr:hypothetical protein IQ07DRAFT_585886 [Pyrenochaeta sp. DS3sAY3a]
MKVLIVGATGAIGNAILTHLLSNQAITHIVALTRRALPSSTSHAKLSNILIPDFGALDAVAEETWTSIADADALIWAMGTYTVDEAVNLNYPLAFQEKLAEKMGISTAPQILASHTAQQPAAKSRFKFILLGGAFVEPDQSRALFFLTTQRRMKGVLQTRTQEFAAKHADRWQAIVIRPGGVAFGGDTLRNRVAERLFGMGLLVRAEEVAACVGDLVVNGADGDVLVNKEIVEKGRRVLGSSK